MDSWPRIFCEITKEINKLNVDLQGKDYKNYSYVKHLETAEIKAFRNIIHREHDL